MTENEAKFLEKLDELANDLEVDMYSVANLNFFFEESANTIRKLIEENQQYRAIGTVEHIQLTFELCKGLDAMTKMYEAIGTIEEFKALKEKNEPKKDNNDSGRCKYCGTYNNFIINKLANLKGHPVIHCWNCGQAIDWQ